MKKNGKKPVTLVTIVTSNRKIKAVTSNQGVKGQMLEEKAVTRGQKQ